MAELPVPGGLEWCASPGSTMRHTSECPHLDAGARAALVPLAPSEWGSFSECSSCRDIVDGARRRTFASIDAALEAFHAPLENRARIRQVATGLPHGTIWMPSSGSYIGIAEVPGAPASAYFGKGYVDVHRDSGYDREWLPANGAGAGASGVPRAGAPAEKTCPTCSLVLPATGRCDDCDG